MVRKGPIVRPTCSDRSGCLHTGFVSRQPAIFKKGTRGKCEERSTVSVRRLVITKLPNTSHFSESAVDNFYRKELGEDKILEDRILTPAEYFVWRVPEET